ncbi:hypothetical protein DFQ01_11068 [Paenibacillus cellulosilyticus]|uniref:Uncharacterized protein n=1 Tax=Paenibacillus cellulosilyticus TaxID=375489 RepID=A0A2V2YSJ6_9BACL|nr:hypothetical protein [Paenibacillus cellulosilyticus]PWW01178.1 hypothetical protein DFQ01_11068 [Paenibacillus cellulosilyticus]QKS46862.1 hypothetical protein HUB94_20480 [Paenibacillus cellulosilyticus]
MRSQAEAVEELRRLQRGGAPASELVLTDIIAESEERILIRHTHLLLFGKCLMPAYHYEIWNSKQNYDLGQRTDSEGRIYCSSYATVNEHYVLSVFNNRTAAEHRVPG